MLKDGKLVLPKQVGSWKTRGNYQMGLCFDDCQCVSCRKKKEDKCQKKMQLTR